MAASGRLPWLRRLPNTAFGIPLGFGGQAVLWKNVQMRLAMQNPRSEGTPEALNILFWWLCTGSVFVIYTFFVAKAFVHWDVVKKEWAHPIRFNFFCGPPVISILFITIAMPTSFEVTGTLMVFLWAWAFVQQLSAGVVAYHRWIYNTNPSDTVSAPYLLCIVSWFLLPVLGQSPAVNIDYETGLPLTRMCFGVGVFWCLLIYPFIVSGVHAGRTKQGSPALFLMVAPPSIAGIALGGPRFVGSFDGASECVLGMVVFLFILLLTGNPTILKQPEVLGVYWAYVFPPCAVSVLALKVDQHNLTKSSGMLAFLLVTIASLMFLAVFVRMSAHWVLVFRGKAEWPDPLAGTVKPAPAKDEEEASGQVELAEI